MSTPQKPAARDFSVDLVKTLAIFAVVAIHSCGFDKAAVGTFPWLSTLFWGTVTRAAVPLFLMCTGALFLRPERELTIKRLYLKYIPRVLAAMYFWAMACKIGRLFLGQTLTAAAVWREFKQVLILQHEKHFYYLHILLLVYALLPVLRALIAGADRKTMRYMLAVWFAVGILFPTVNTFRPFRSVYTLNSFWMLNMAFTSAGYALLGRYIAEHGREVKARFFAGAAAAGAAIIFFGTWLLSAKSGATQELFLSGMTVGPCALAIGIFGLCGKVKKPPKAFASAVEYASKASFCVYLTHVFPLYFFDRYNFAYTFATPLLSIPIVATTCVLVCTALYAVLSRIPVVRKWLI